MRPTRIITTEVEDETQSLPMWVRATAVVGIPGVIAIYLVWFLANALPSKLEAHAQETRDAMQVQLRMLQQICLNTADTPEERGACWSVRP